MAVYKNLYYNESNEFPLCWTNVFSLKTKFSKSIIEFYHSKNRTYHG